MKSIKLLGFLGEANTWEKVLMLEYFPSSENYSCYQLSSINDYFFLRCVKVHNKINFYIPLNFVMTEHT